MVRIDQDPLGERKKGGDQKVKEGQIVEGLELRVHHILGCGSA